MVLRGLAARVAKVTNAPEDACVSHCDGAHLIFSVGRGQVRGLAPYAAPLKVLSPIGKQSLTEPVMQRKSLVTVLERLVFRSV